MKGLTPMISPASALTPLGGGAYRYLWPMMPDIPVAHQRGEAITDLMDFLRTLGMVLLSEPRASIQHGTKPLMTLRFHARYASDGEARTLHQDPHPTHKEADAA